MQVPHVDGDGQQAPAAMMMMMMNIFSIILQPPLGLPTQLVHAILLTFCSQINLCDDDDDDGDDDNDDAEDDDDNDDGSSRWIMGATPLPCGRCP